MRGKQMAFQAELERTVAQAWYVENFSRTGKKFKDLGHYLKALQPRRPQTAAEVVAIFQGFADRGLARITVREK